MLIFNSPIYSFQMNHSTVCLSYLFTDRSFDDGVMGLAYVAYAYGQPGGVCDPYADYGSMGWKSYNTGSLSYLIVVLFSSVDLMVIIEQF